VWNRRDEGGSGPSRQGKGEKGRGEGEEVSPGHVKYKSRKRGADKFCEKKKRAAIVGGGCTGKNGLNGRGEASRITHHRREKKSKKKKEGGENQKIYAQMRIKISKAITGALKRAAWAGGGEKKGGREMTSDSRGD